MLEQKTILVTGATGQVAFPIVRALAATNRSIVGARMGRAVLARDIPWLVGEWRAGRLKLAELVSARYPLDDINAAVAATRAGAARRNVIVFGDAG